MTRHISVMADKAIELVNVKEDGIYVDGTLGRGGHSKLILEKLKSGRLYCFDLDEDAIRESKQILKDYDNVVYIHDNFANMDQYVDKVDGILLDLGVSSPQFDEPERGFSYRNDGPLDMRMNKEDKLSAYEVVNNYSEQDLVRILFDYGEEKNARRIARSIVENRPLNTTFELVEAIKKALPAKVLSKKGHPAKQSFQALRIEVNHELDSLKKFLNEFDGILNKNGRVVIITFHSLEDRLVKRAFKAKSSVEDDLRIALRPEEVRKADYRLLNHGDKAEQEEVEINRRAKSAIIRGIEKING
ncbi:MAG: 16S rRNA (cytosine(1402)-N(4))-methyltransferase RsmH [Erysipelotrichaceae bacterium]|nr:16S rRNA (cytosine(1402)-N(4))-methyltransferase RsmH [Erysipelotrichaceae bacterium]